jgi:hypothetical protein
MVGFAQMSGDVFHLNALKAVAAATAASPAPKVFSAVKGLETYSSRLFIESASQKANSQSFEITPELYSRLRGPYNRRNVFGAVLAYGPVLASDPHTRPLFDSVSRYALCGHAPLLRELGMPASSVAPLVQVRIEVRPGSRTESLPLVLPIPCR